MRISHPLLLNFFFLIAACSQNAPQPKSADAINSVLLRNFHIIAMTPEQQTPLANGAVLIQDGIITKIGPSANINAPTNAQIIEGNGRTLIPGLIDMHVHIWDEAELSAYLSYGITTIRNASGMPFHLDFQTEINAGTLTGPRLFTTGPILNGPGPNAQVNHQIVTNAEEASQAVRDQYAKGYRNLKVYSNLSRDSYEAILGEANRLGLTVMGHTPEGIRAAGIPAKKPFNISFSELLDDGFTTIEHMESIVWHALYDELDESKARELAQKIAAAKIVISPTLIAHRNLLNVAAGKEVFLERSGVETLNPFISETEQPNYQFWLDQPVDTRQAQDTFYRKAVKIFHEEGVVLVAGTDAGIFTNIPGNSLIQELSLYVQAGLSPYEALETATTNPGLTFGDDIEIGQIKAGFAADLLILDDSPLKDLKALRQPSGMVVNGRWFDKTDIETLREQAVQTSYERTMERVLSGLAAQGSAL